MRSTLRALWLLVGTAVRTEPWRSATVLLEPVAQLSFALFAIWLKYLTDGVVEQNTTYILIGVAGIAGVQALAFVISLVANDLRLVLGERVGFAFDRELSRLVASVSGLEHFERPDYRDKLELLRKSQTALGGSLNSLLNVVNGVVGGVGTLAVLASLDPALLLLALFVLPAVPLAGVQQKWQRESEESSATPSRLALHLRGLTTDRNAGMELRVFGLQEEVRARFRSAALAARRATLWAERRIAWTNAGRQLFFALGYVAAIAYMLRSAVRGQATVGDVVAAVYVCRQVAGSIIGPIFSVSRLGAILRAAERLLWLRDYAEADAEGRSGTSSPPPRLREGITLENVSFTYPGTHRPVLEDVSLQIPAGTVIALVGENGAGKTTLVKLLARMYEPTGGRILVDGIELPDIGVDTWRQRLSAAFQDFARPELVARRAVGIGDLSHLDDEAAVLESLDRAGAADVTDALPDGLSSQLGSSWKDGVDLSTGQWQKLALGRALMRGRPLMVFFDEPTASLDAPTEHALFQRYAAAARDGSETGTITVLVSHRFSTVHSADLILVLEDGRVAELGSHEELMEHRGTYAELYSLQAESYA